ncbi:MAG: putative lipid II flippase FtsW [Bdellovibrionaceae bacterium]|nr:putative lipid II flippase FtsW [Pseudobdellovibrionaceae bacterium]
MARILSSSLLLGVIALFGIGLVQVYSSSYIFATESYGDGLYFFQRQLLFTLMALVVLFGTASIPFKYIERWGWTVWPAAAALVALTFVPGFGVRVGGALRWLQLPFGIRFEPSELLKISFVLLFASLLNRREHFLSRVHWFWILIGITAPFVLLLKQPDFGSFAIIMLVGVSLLFAFGLRWRWIVTTFAVLVPAFYLLVMKVPYRAARVHAFLDPWADPEQKGFQAIQSMMSFHAGGLTGAGLGQGQGKLFFLPEAHTDFTLAVFGEEMGFVGVMLLLALYAFIVFRGVQIAVKAEDSFKRATALGFSMVFGLSVFINAGVVTGLLPTKGLTLPFLSYGGSSLLCLAFMFGLLLSVESAVEGDPFTERFQRLKKRNKGRA